VGLQALLNNTTGGYNLALGYIALQANTTASNNMAIGPGALAANTTGASNVGLGRNALNANTTASSNTAVGHASLAANTTGHSTIAVGTGAGQAVTTGTHNVCLGLEAGYGGTTISRLTTGGSNTLVGAICHATAAAANYANGFGYNLDCEAGYTTIGQAAEDIRAVHGTATWAAVSDQRYKKDIADSTTGLNFINALQPRTFNYKTLGELPETFRAYKADSTEVYKSSQTQHGFIAQEIKAAIDADSSIADGFKLWDDREDGSQEVAEAALIPVLVKAIQELTARLETLEGE
jgi:hypothetical protein